MSRVTERDLHWVVKRLNEVTGNSVLSHTVVDGKYVVNVGHYHIDHAYGQVKLVQYCTDGAGTRDVTSRGSKPEIYREIHRYMDGYIQAQRDAARRKPRLVWIDGQGNEHDLEQIPDVDTQILETLKKRLKGE